jgi:CheY-like chemotaxis protein
MDVQMPEMDGYEATKNIRKKLKNRPFPILAMTANAMLGDEQKCLDSGMNGYVTKPLDNAILFQKISESILKHEEELKPLKVQFQKQASSINNSIQNAVLSKQEDLFLSSIREFHDIIDGDKFFIKIINLLKQIRNEGLTCDIVLFKTLDNEINQTLEKLNESIS